MKSLLRTNTLLALATAVAILVVRIPSSAIAQNLDFMYVGSAGSFPSGANPGAMGALAGQDACREKYTKLSTMCTSKMIIENGAHPKAGFVPLDGAWVNPHPVGTIILGDAGLRVVDFSLRISQIENFNCDYWLAGVGSGSSGLVLARNFNPGFVPWFSERACSVSRPVACCGGNPNQFAIKGEDQPPRGP